MQSGDNKQKENNNFILMDEIFSLKICKMLRVLKLINNKELNKRGRYTLFTRQ